MPDRKRPISSEDMLYFQGDPNDTRFQFDIIKQLAESVRDLNRTQTLILERLARIEEQRVHEIAAKLTARIEILETEKERREGAYSVFGWLRIWGPVIFSLATILYLFGRSLGVVPAPPVPQQRVEAVVPRDLEPARKGETK